MSDAELIEKLRQEVRRLREIPGDHPMTFSELLAEMEPGDHARRVPCNTTIAMQEDRSVHVISYGHPDRGIAPMTAELLHARWQLKKLSLLQAAQEGE